MVHRIRIRSVPEAMPTLNFGRPETLRRRTGGITVVPAVG